MELLLILFKSRLPEEDVLAIDDDRAEKYLGVKGLILKFYVQDKQSNHIGGVFVFDSKENLKSFLESTLARSTSKAYKFIESPMIRVLEIKRALITNTAMTLHE